MKSNDPLTLLEGDCLERLAELPDASVQCCVTSPPYYGLRDYGHEGQIGLEDTPEAYVARLVEVFRQVRRVLREDGTVWLNLGDSYASSGGSGAQGKSGQREGRSFTARDTSAKGWGNTKPKDLIGIPWRVAFALQADGWYLRQDIIWSKPNPMPESVRDRCTKAHEYLFLLTKAPRYYFDAKAVQEPLATGSVKRLSQNVESQQGSDRVPGKTNGRMKAVYTKPYTGKATKPFEEGGAQNASETKKRIVDGILSGKITGRNKRSVWTVTTQPFKGAHFATFPKDLVEPCILAGSRKGDTVLDPFGGSGTTGLVALEHGRRAILIELNPEYAAMARERCSITVGLGL